MALAQLMETACLSIAAGPAWPIMTDSLNPESVPVSCRLRRYHQPAIATPIAAARKPCSTVTLRAATVGSREEIGWQAKAPAPQERKPLCTNVGQTLSSVNPAISAIVSQLLRERLLPRTPSSSHSHNSANAGIAVRKYAFVSSPKPSVKPSPADSHKSQPRTAIRTASHASSENRTMESPSLP